jgi:hypothetical protein
MNRQEEIEKKFSRRNRWKQLVYSTNKKNQKTKINEVESIRKEEMPELVLNGQKTGKNRQHDFLSLEKGTL